ncbi:hypothetical protein LMBV_063 [Largemouth bass virus]|uniref:Uncharacterized protein n=1 Tax=Largemouth bass virus TaxID=176656 RepID=A0A9X7TVT1_9VIRU|nr:hypothetical protein LMBV_063 [Largemouth bass virus]QJE49212.1 hypothetical protein LMBV_063 [Largemouth bass virus]
MDDTEYKPEFAAKDRAGGDIEEGLDLFSNTVFRGIEGDPVQRFFTGVESVGRQLIKQDYITLSKDEQNQLLRGVRELPYPNYKNPAGAVLGFYITRGGGPVRKDRLAKVQEFLPEVSDMDSKDLIRYCRLWQKIFV